LCRRKEGRKHEGGRVQETETDAQFHYSEENAEFPKTSKIGKRRSTAPGGNPRILGQEARATEQREKGGGQVVENFLYR